MNFNTNVSAVIDEHDFMYFLDEYDAHAYTYHQVRIDSENTTVTHHETRIDDENIAYTCLAQNYTESTRKPTRRQFYRPMAYSKMLAKVLDYRLMTKFRLQEKYYKAVNSKNTKLKCPSTSKKQKRRNRLINYRKNRGIII